MSIRAEMGKDNVLRQGIVEADKTYIGGKRKKDYDKEVGEPRKRGRGTAKVFGLLSSVPGMEHTTTIQQHTRPCISQRPAINTTTEMKISSRSFSLKV